MANQRISPAESLGNKWSARFWAIDGAMALIDRFLPIFERSVIVQVIGKPFADLTKLYEFTLSVASGIINNIPFASVKSFQTEINYMKKIIVTTVGYEASGIRGLGVFTAPQTLPVSDPTKAGEYPRFLTINENPGFLPFPAELKDGSGYVNVLQTNPIAANPGMNYERGTMDQNNIVANPAALINPKSTVPQPDQNVIYQGDIPLAKKIFLQKLFGFVPQ